MFIHNGHKGDKIYMTSFQRLGNWGSLNFCTSFIVKAKEEVILEFSPGLSHSKMVHHTILPRLAVLSKCCMSIRCFLNW